MRLLENSYTRSIYDCLKEGTSIPSMNDEGHKYNNKKLKENDDSYSKGIEILDRVYKNQGLEDSWNEAFNKLVPKTGNAKTDIGEVLRCFSSLSHAFYQNGDIISRLQYQPGYYHDALDLSKAVNNIGDSTLIDLVDKMWGTRLESAYAKYMASFYEYFINKYLKDSNLEESTKPKEKKEDKRVLMQQGNVSCVKENNIFKVFENEDENLSEYDNQDEAMKDALSRCSIDPDNELKDEIKESTVINEAANLKLINLLKKKEELYNDDTISEDDYYTIIERLDNEIINEFTDEEIEEAERELEQELSKE